MKEKKKSAVSWILTWAGQKRIAYVWSVLLAIGNVIFKILPYFIIADVVKLFLNGEKEFEIYLAKAVLIALSFIIAELLHSLSTALSHKATFAVLANIRKSCCDKLARVPLGYVKDTPSGTFKNIMVERIDSIETTLAHIVPEFTSNLLAPIVILIYFFLTDWRLALWSLVPVIVGFLSYFGMMLDYKPSFERTVQTTKDLNDAAVEYIDGIEVIKAFGKTESSYAKFTKAAMAYADSFISWMKRCSIFHGLMMVVTPYTLLTVLPFGAHYVANGTLAISDFVICIILSLGIVGPLITVGSYTDDLGKIGVIVGEVAGILEQPELERPEKSKSVPKDNSVTLEDVRFGYHDKEILHGVTMELKAGTVNAIVGPSGSGKSTIAKLIAFPLMYRNARAAFEQVDVNLIAAGKTLGMSDRRIFWTVVMPTAGPGIASGTVLAFARAIGEYGATSMLAGNILGKTRTVSVAIASETAAGNYGMAGFWVVVILIISFVIVAAINIVSGKGMKMGRWM